MRPKCPQRRPVPRSRRGAGDRLVLRREVPLPRTADGRAAAGEAVERIGCRGWWVCGSYCWPSCGVENDSAQNGRTGEAARRRCSPCPGQARGTSSSHRDGKRQLQKENPALDARGWRFSKSCSAIFEEADRVGRMVKDADGKPRPLHIIPFAGSRDRNACLKGFLLCRRWSLRRYRDSL